MLLHSVISLAHVQFKCKISFETNTFFHKGMKQFKSNNYIVRDQPTRDESALCFIYAKGHNFSQSINNGFRNNFKQDVVEVDWSKIRHMLRISNFWNEHYICIIDVP